MSATRESIGRRVERGAVAAYTSFYRRQMALPPTREHYPQFAATVTRVQDLTRAFRRVTLHAPDLRDVARLGPDEYVGLYLPPSGRPLVLPPDALNPRPALEHVAEQDRPELRWYTIRNHRRDSAEIDIDVVSVGHDGPGARWIAQVKAGDPVGVRVQSACYAGAPESGHHLLVADETGLPGLAAILQADRDRPGTRRLTAFVEVPSPDHVYEGLDEERASVLVRGTEPPGSAVLAALEELDLTPVDYGWVCAEAATAAGVRRHLVRTRGVPRRSVMSSGFWKVGSPRL